jgi:hypothetical protein
MDTVHLWRLLVILCIAVTGIFYVFLYRPLTIPMPLPHPSEIPSFETYYEHFVDTMVQPENQEAVRSMQEYRL